MQETATCELRLVAPLSMAIAARDQEKCGLLVPLGNVNEAAFCACPVVLRGKQGKQDCIVM